METDVHLAHSFVEFARRKLCEEFWPRVCTCLDSLSDDQVWWRPNTNSNSIGNLLLHLNGNLRQWILVPLAGEADQRDRDAEFAERKMLATQDLRRNLDQTIRTIDQVLAKLGPDDLTKTYRVQNHFDVSALGAIFHVIEHFAMHYGQILYITKMLTGTDLGFFKYLEKQKR